MSTKNQEFHPRQWVDCSSAAYKRRRLARLPEYHPRQWVDCSSAAYKRRRLARLPEYHPRQWVDCSSAAYEPSNPSASVFHFLPRVARGDKVRERESRGRRWC